MDYTKRKNKFYRLKLQMVRALHITHGSITKYDGGAWVAANKEISDIK